LSEFGGGEVGLPPHRREAGRHQQRIVLAQRHVEGDGEPYHHVAARRCAAEFEETQVPLRDVRPTGEFKLRQAPFAPPQPEACCEIVPMRHEYLPGSCRGFADRENATTGLNKTC
jgi:hypothetical protein